MRSIPFITDSPFRLLGVSSSTSMTDLRRRAKRAAKAAKVGIDQNVPLADLLGSDDLVRCDDLVLLLAGDPVRRTMYRMCWPIGLECSAGQCTPFEELWNAPCATGAERAQRCFISSWLHFVCSEQPGHLAKALASYDELQRNAAYGTVLSSLLVSEGIPEAEAQAYVANALRAVGSSVLETACRCAMESYELGYITRAQDILRIISDSAFDDEMRDRALLLIVPCGEREAASIRQRMEADQNAKPEDLSYDGSDVVGLMALADALDGHHPVAQRWKEVVDERLTQMVMCMRSRALKLAEEQQDFDSALEILARVHRLPLSERAVRQIEDDMLLLGVRKEGLGRQRNSKKAEHKRSEPLEDTCRFAMVLWQSGNKDEAINLLHTVCEHTSDRGKLAEALRVVQVVGDAETAQLEQEIMAFEGWLPQDGALDLGTVKDLRRLAEAVQDHLPVCAWIEACDTRTRQVAIAMRNCAVRIANESGDHEEAAKILYEVSRLDLPHDIRDRVRQDIEDIKAILRDKALFENLKPIKRAPDLETINGCGMKLYGSTRFEGREGWRFMTLYFVLFYLPVLPLRQYVVSNEGHGYYVFHAAAPFGRRNWIHLGIVLATLAFLIWWP